MWVKFLFITDCVIITPFLPRFVLPNHTSICFILSSPVALWCGSFFITILHSIPYPYSILSQYRVIFAHPCHVFIDNSYHALLTFLHFPFFLPPTLAGVPQVPSSAIRHMQTGCSSPVPCRCQVKSPACRGWRWCPYTELSLWPSTLSFLCPMFVLKNSWSTTIFTG